MAFKQYIFKSVRSSARPRKDGRRATGIQSKKGYLYIVTSNTTFRNGAKVTEKVWTATGLSDTPENVKKASEARERLCNKAASEAIDKNITIQKYGDKGNGCQQA